MRNIQLLLLGMLCCSQSILASDEDILLIERPWDFGIALGYGELSNPFLGSDDVPTHLTVDFAWYGEKFFFDNGTLGYTLIDTPRFGFQVISHYSSDRIYHSFFNDLGVRRFDANGNSIVDPSTLPPVDVSPAPPVVIPELELPDRDFALNVGLELLAAGQFGELQASLTTDATSKHEGHEAIISFSRHWQLQRLGITTSVGATWKSEELVGYYYGLEPDENPGLIISYDGESTTNTDFTLGLNYPLRKNTSLIGQFSYVRLGSGIRNSPLIESDHTRSVFLGVFFHF